MSELTADVIEVCVIAVCITAYLIVKLIRGD